MYYARLTGPDNTERLFRIIDYKDGIYWVFIDFVFPMKLSKIVWKQEEE